MLKAKLIQKINLIILVAYVLSTQPAYAYIDPGSGSAIISAIIGFFVALGITVKTYWYKLKDLFKRGKSRNDKDN
tara:strand:- start:25 stop:249 length:225 start_codon:yes stop_codon:yes gene_type:complete